MRVGTDGLAEVEPETNEEKEAYFMDQVALGEAAAARCTFIPPLSSLAIIVQLNEN